MSIIESKNKNIESEIKIIFTCPICGFETDDHHQADLHGNYPDHELHGFPKGRFKIILNGYAAWKSCFVCGKEARICKRHGKNGWSETWTCIEHINKRAKPSQQSSSPYLPFITACMKKR